MRKSCSVLLLSALVACSPDDVNRIEGPPSPARIEAFSVSRLLVRPGDSVAIAWDVRNTNEVALFANEEELDIGGRTEGEITHVVEEETRFRLVAGPEGSRVSREILVGVRAPDDRTLILSFVPDPPLVDAGEPTRLAWVTRNATEVKILDENDEVVPLGDASAEQGSVEVRPDRNATYRLVATGKSGTAERSASVRVRGQPAVEAGVSKPSIVPGETVTLSWAVLDALRVVVREVGGPVLVDTELSMAGSVEVQPSRSTEYEVRGMGAWRDTVEILRVEVAPRILSFELEGEGPLAIGTLATLRWTTVGATRLYLSNLEGAEEEIGGYRLDEGSIRLPVGNEGRFLLRAVGGGGEEVEQSITTEVFGTPSIASFSVSPELQSAGLQPVTVTVSWAGIENADRVRLETDTLGRMGIFEAPFDDGELPLFLTETTEFTLIAENEAGEVRRTATATVVPLPKINDFFVFPSHASAGEPVLIQWDVEQAVSVSIEWEGQPLPIDPTSTSGTYTFMAEEAGRFRLLAANSLGGTTERDQGLTIGPMEIREFSLPKMLFQLGEPLEFHWANLGGTELELLQDGNPVCHADTKDEIQEGGCTVFVTQSSRPTFTLRLTNNLGQAIEEELQPLVSDGPFIHEFRGAPILCQGEELELSWVVSNDFSGNPPVLQLTDGDGNTYDVSGRNPNQGTFKIPYKGLGTHEYVLTAGTPGTMEDAVSFSVEYTDETQFLAIEVDPPFVSPGQEVTVSWKTVCANEVRVPYGKKSFVELFDAPFIDLSQSAGATFEAMTDWCDNEGNGWEPRDEGCHLLDFPGGFVFPFDGVDRTAIKLFANGVAGFNLGRRGSSFSNSTLPATGSTWVNFALFWRDLFLDPEDTGFYKELITEKNKEGLVIQWGRLTDGSKFQLVLWEDGTFDFRYGTFNNTSTDPVIGFQNSTATEWEALAQKAQVPGGLANRTWRYGFPAYPPTASITLNPTSSFTLPLEAVGLDEILESVEIVVVE